MMWIIIRIRFCACNESFTELKSVSCLKCGKSWVAVGKRYTLGILF